MSVRVVIGADLVPTESNYTLFKDGDAEKLFGIELLKSLNEMDFRIFNLETPLIDKNNSILKYGASLRAPLNTINGFKSINVDFLTLANNHIMDQGIEGLKSTKTILNNNSIDFSGVGDNIRDARRPYVKVIKGIKIGIYCCAEHEFSIATDSFPGANPYDPLTSFDDVKELSNNCNFTIVLYHGGKELYRYPSPNLQRVFRKFAESGAKLVIAQHTHCIGCMEEYFGSMVIYGQGNFLFDHSDDDFRKTSLLVSASIDPFSFSATYSFIPIVKHSNTIQMASTSESNEILKAFYERSSLILNKDFVHQKYAELAQKNKSSVFLALSGKMGNVRFKRLLNKITNYKYIENNYSSDSTMLKLLNMLNCETHYELALYIFKRLYNNSSK